jgi:hypothetical protein
LLALAIEFRGSGRHAPVARRLAPSSVSLASREGNAVSVAMAEGKHPVPFRTRKLSPPAPMVLPRRRGGRVGRCRDILRREGPLRGPFFAFQVRFQPCQPSVPEESRSVPPAAPGSAGRRDRQRRPAGHRVRPGGAPAPPRAPSVGSGEELGPAPKASSDGPNRMGPGGLSLLLRLRRDGVNRPHRCALDQQPRAVGVPAPARLEIWPTRSAPHPGRARPRPL